MKMKMRFALVLAAMAMLASFGASAQTANGQGVAVGTAIVQTGDTTAQVGVTVGGTHLDVGGTAVNFAAARPAKLQGALPGIPGSYGPPGLFIDQTNSVNIASVPFVTYFDWAFNSAKPELTQYRVGTVPYSAFKVGGASGKTTMYFVGSPGYFNPANGAKAEFIESRLSSATAVIPLGYLFVSPEPGHEQNVSLPLIEFDALQFVGGTLKGYPNLALIKSPHAMGAGLGQMAKGTSMGAGIGGSHTGLTGFLGLTLGGSTGDSVTFMVSQLSVPYLVVALDPSGVLVEPDAYDKWHVAKQQAAVTASSPVSAAAAVTDSRLKKK